MHFDFDDDQSKNILNENCTTSTKNKYYKIQNNKKSDTHNMYTKENNIENKTTEKPKTIISLYIYIYNYQRLQLCTLLIYIYIFSLLK